MSDFCCWQGTRWFKSKSLPQTIESPELEPEHHRAPPSALCRHAREVASGVERSYSNVSATTSQSICSIRD
ncbi:hypothetical protein Bca52824_052088 [Brassica carinata]|uniref:Uncharacterized protein n=2 Tax=Brassica TaxID=3705 RepID=A0A8X7R1F2_BRACI|nr:hypothetical protein Bca52824_052088 [Brassica carinata]VDD21926.1 unnamed protein product [Brassica oleracea]